jgi:serine/threonine-protein kinase
MSDRHDKTLAQVGAPAGVNARYRVVRELGAGGMGSVHLAEDTKLPRQVAIKTIKPDLCANPEILKRIDRECKLHAKIGSHPHIVTLYDRLEDDGHISLVMEYVPGETLQDLIARNASQGRRLQWEQGVGIASQMLEALARIHASGIVHRDIKPSNILLAQDDMGRFTAKLMDFGIARLEVEEDGYTNLTREGGSGPGTPLYMAPEQIDPKTFGAICPSTDLYATGVMLYQIISGRPPFGGSLTEIFNGHLNATPPPLQVDPGVNLPAGLADVLRKALAKHPKERFTSAREFREALEHLRASEPGELVIATAASFDPSKTMSSSEATASGFEKGGTLLDTTTAGGGRKKPTSTMAVIALAAVVVLTAGGFALFSIFGSATTDGGAEPQETATATAPTADTTDTVAEPSPTESSALGQLQEDLDSPPNPSAANVDASVIGGQPPAIVPAGMVMPDGPVEAPDGVMTAPGTPAPNGEPIAPDSGSSALDAFKSAAPAPEPEPADSGGTGSALDALLNNQPAAQSPDTSVNPPAPEPPAPAPAVAPAPAPAPKPKPKPAVTTPAPKPSPPPPTTAKTEPNPDSGANPWSKGVKVKSVESRKVN